MKRFLALVLAVAGLAAPAFAQTPQPPELAARQYILIDLSSQQVLAEREADAQAEPASLTKLMTAYLVFEALRDKKIALEQTLPVSERAWAERKGGGSLMFIEPRMSPKVDELLRGMIVQSGNDASVALAEGVSGTVEAFVEQMNRRAQAWGLKNTQFRNVTGLTEPGHYSSARDMAVLAGRIITDFPDFYRYYSIRDYTFNNIKQPNRNRLLFVDPTVDGVKTGHTEAAGWCLIASALRGERRLVSVVLGAASDAARAAESQRLLNYGFQAYDTVQLYQSGRTVTTLAVWKGSAKEVKAGFLADRHVTLPKGQAAKLALTLVAQERLIAPIASGQRVGLVRVTFEDRPVAEFPLIALEDVPQASLLGRAWDTVRLWFTK